MIAGRLKAPGDQLSEDALWLIKAVRNDNCIVILSHINKKITLKEREIVPMSIAN